MEYNQEQLLQTGYAMKAWDRAITEGYAFTSIKKNVGAELYNLMIGGVVGILASFALIAVGTAGGAAIGAGIGGYFSAGNPAVATATAELGAAIGRTVAQSVLAAIGVVMVLDYMVDHMWEVGRYLMAAYDIATNQLPYVNGQLYEFLLDLSARWFAEAVGMFCGFVVFALAALMMVRFAKNPGEKATAVRDLFNCKLNEVCKGIVQYILPRAQDLRYKMQPGGRGRFVVISGGIGPGQISIISYAAKLARRIMPRLIDQGSRLVIFKSFTEFSAFLKSEGFRLTEVKEWGPPGGKQLFYERGNICCRVKTMGDKGGPRGGKPHISFGMNDGTGTTWYNDLAKFSYDGRLAFKNNTPAANFKPTETISNPGAETPQRYIGIQGGLDTRSGAEMQDAWAARTHFNLPDSFNWGGLDAALQGI